MSVYTSLEANDLSAFLAPFSVGTLHSFQGIAAGMENTNYFVSTTQGDYVLTLFEQQNADEVRDVMRLARHLEEQGIQVPAPISDTHNNWLHHIKHKPSVLCAKLPGSHIHNPEPAHCYAIGKALAELHLAAQNLANPRANMRDYSWWISAGPQLTQHLSLDEQALLASELEFQTSHRNAWLTLPHGWIHADLFHDNVLFENDQRVGAILDLYNACHGAWLYDLAVVANDWCTHLDGNWKILCLETLLEGYNSVRTLTEHEQALWGVALRGAALRFWLSRLLTREHQKVQGGELALQKDPNEYCQKLRQHRAQFTY